jgi:hypothetical protein
MYKAGEPCETKRMVDPCIPADGDIIGQAEAIQVK